MNTTQQAPPKPTYKAFHPQTMGVMYNCVPITWNTTDRSVAVTFPTVTGSKRFTIPQSHIAIDGELIESKQPKPVSSLVFFIEAHCGCAVERYDGPASKTITVSCDTLGGIREVETIPATLKAVKDWLGY